MKIARIVAQELLDSRGNPTVEVEITLENGIKGSAMVPSGASTGEKEAVELRDKDMERYKGKGVLTAVKNVNNIISPALIGMDITCQKEIDYKMIELDGTENKSRLGANAILGVSMAVARTAAYSLGIPLFQYLGGVNAVTIPVPCMNVINGGAHANNSVDFQEFMIAPHNAYSFEEAIRMGIETFHVLKDVLDEKGYNTGVGDEGGYAPELKSNEEALEVIIEAIKRAGYKPGIDISICMDPAVSEMWDNEQKKYSFAKSTKDYKTSEEMIEIFQNIINKYPVISLEDGLGENDWSGWKKMTEVLGNQIELVGDDIFCTNKKILQEAIDKKVANSILIKLNQIGTVTESLETIELAKKNGYNCFISHRSGETEDNFLADFAVATGAGHLKTGSGCRSERISKFNQLLRIERMLGKMAVFAGREGFKKN